MRPRFAIINAMLAALALAAWWAGLFDAFGALGDREVAMLAALGAYFALGLIVAWRGDWEQADRIANALPAWGLGFTGVGLLLAASGLHSLTPDALSQVFRELVFAVAPNIVGVIGFAWLSTLHHWGVSTREGT